MQDIRVALRHFRKSPGFAITVVLTIALGIGANTAIFTLVHAILMKSLPVGDPKTLYRVGDLDDCCVNGGFLNDKGDFDLFSYQLYKHFRDNTPEFERLAAMQSGSDTMTVRRGSEQAKSERSEYVSGNYFTTFGIAAVCRAHADRHRRHRGGSPSCRVELSGMAVRLRRRSQHSGRNHLSAKQAPDRSRHSPARILWRPNHQQPAGDLDPAGIGADDRWRQCQPECAGQQLALCDRANQTGSKPAGTASQNVHQPAAMALHPAQLYRKWRLKHNSQAARGYHTWRGRYSEPATADRQGTLSAHGHLRTGAAGGLRQRGQPPARARRNPQSRNLHPHGAGRGTQTAGAADAHRERATGVPGRRGRAGGSLCGNADHPRTGISRLTEPSHPGQPVAARPRLCLSAVAGDRHRLRHRPGMDHLPLRPGGGAARHQPLDPRPRLPAAEVTDRLSGGPVSGPARGRRTADPQPQQHGAPELRPADRQPLCAAPGCRGGRLHSGKTTRSLSSNGRSIWISARRKERRPGALQHAGGEQLGRRSTRGRAARRRDRTTTTTLRGTA